jgi:tripartite-type tricarboxylate transporter receptor subunit TctC
VKRAGRWLLALSCIFFCVAGNAQPYPSRAVTIVVGFPPGGPQDLIARGIAKKLAERLGQPFIVENRPGAAGTTAIAGVARAAPDGYTLSLASLGTLVVTPLSRKGGVPYDPATAFTPVAALMSQPLILIVAENGPYKTLQDLLSDGRRKTGKFNYSTAGIGSLSHFASEQLNKAAGTDFVHVPYPGAAPALRALLAGEVAMYFAAGSDAVPRLGSGQVRALLVSLPKRFPLAKEVPSLEDAGLKDPVMDQWFGLVGPAGMPREAVLKLNEAVQEALRDPALAASVPGSIAIPGTPEEFAAMIKADLARVAKQVEITGFSAE